MIDPISSPQPESEQVPEADHKPPFGAWWRMYVFVLAFMGLLVLAFYLLSNSFAA